MTQNHSFIPESITQYQRSRLALKGWVWTCCFGVGVLIAFDSNRPSHANPAVPPQLSQSASGQRSASQPSASQPSSTSASRWQKLVERMSRDRSSGRRGSSRGDICQLSARPGEMVWHQQPLLIWQGRDRTIALQKVEEPAKAQEQQSLIWQTTATYDPNLPAWAYRYDGPQLNPGTSYRWSSVTDLTSPNSTPDQLKGFKVIGAAERLQLTQQLKAHIEAVHHLQSTEIELEEKALLEASFFTEQKLYSDAIQILLSVKEPSPLLQESIDSILSSWSQSICR